MNKNTTIGLLLIGLILFGFSWFNSKQVEEQTRANAEAQAREDSIHREWVKANPELAAAEVASSQAQSSIEAPAPLVEDTTALGLALKGVEEFTTLENSQVKITFSNLGGRVAAVELKEYQRLYNTNSDGTQKREPLMLFNTDGSEFGLEFYTPNLVNTAKCYFELSSQSDSSIVYRLYSDSVSYMEFSYVVPSQGYMVDFDMNLSHFKNTIVTNQSDLALNWGVIAPQQEKGFKNENNYTTIAYKFPSEDDIEELSVSTGEQTAQLTTKVQWVGFKQQFFSSIIINPSGFSGANVGYTTFAPTDSNIKDFTASFLLPYSASTDNYNFDFYFGPNKFSVLNEYSDLELQKLVPLGWGIIGWISRFIVIPTFDFLGSYIASYGLIIFLLTLFIKILISPLTFKSYMSSAKMRLLKPELAVIAQKFHKREDAMKKQQATMALYKSAGVSPMGGCLPMLIQLPVLLAMFRFFPSSIELRGQSFLWADDLSSYDSIWTFPDGFTLPFYGDHISLFALLMAVSLFFTSRINMNQQPTAGQDQMKGMKFMMLYMMPIMLLFIFNDSASGLSYYYLLSNLITLIQMWVFRMSVSDEKLHAVLRANSVKNSAKPKKKSKWATRLEEMQKQAEAQQRARNNNKR
ncbi:MAG: membrane protein insertase YidC [Rikenellaceae bacterium]